MDGIWSWLWYFTQSNSSCFDNNLLLLIPPRDLMKIVFLILQAVLKIYDPLLIGLNEV